MNACLRGDLKIAQWLVEECAVDFRKSHKVHHVPVLRIITFFRTKSPKLVTVVKRILIARLPLCIFCVGWLERAARVLSGG